MHSRFSPPPPAPRRRGARPRPRAAAVEVDALDTFRHASIVASVRVRRAFRLRLGVALLCLAARVLDLAALEIRLARDDDDTPEGTPADDALAGDG